MSQKSSKLQKRGLPPVSNEERIGKNQPPSQLLYWQEKHFKT